MNRTPVAAPRTEGRTFDTDWSIANVAKLLRSNASRGVWRQAATTGGSTESVNQYYLRTVSARHLPSGVSVIFMRLEQENCWYASLCFAGTDDGYLPWDPEAAEVWLWALFGEDRPQVKSAGDTGGDARQFTLPMKG
jgi:hypothetical protein